MTLGPRRLKDDTDFQWETGCDLADEQLVVGAYDLSSMRSRIVAGALATGAAVTTAAIVVGDGVPAVARIAGWTMAATMKPLLVATAGAAVLAGAYWLGVQSRVPTSPVPSPTVIEAPLVMPALPSSEGSVPSRAVEVLVAPPSVRTRSVNPGGEGVADEVVAVLAPAFLPDLTVQVSERASGEADEPSTIPAQTELLAAARDAFGESRFALSTQLFEQYLAEWPDGQLVEEAELGSMQARFYLGDLNGTEKLARKIQDYPSLAGRRHDILRLRAESLVQMDRCGEALVVAGELSVRDAAPVKKACRRREGD